MTPVRKSIGVLLLALGVVAPSFGVIRDNGVDPDNLGKGDWIFAIADATNKLSGHVNSVTNVNSLMLWYKSQGIRHLIVKAGTGPDLYGHCPGPQFTSSFVDTAHSNGIFVFGYNRSFATNTPGEVAIADYVFSQGADGFVWDAEAEWEPTRIGTNGPSLAWAQCSTVRSNWPNKFLGHSPFAIIGLHGTFPYKEFGLFCDAVMPQVYHFSVSTITSNLFRSPSATINWTDVHWNNWQNNLVGKSTNVNGVTYYWTNAIKPLACIQDVYGTGSAPTCEGTAAALPAKDVLEFIDYLEADPHAVSAAGYNGAQFFRTDLRDSVQWSYVKSGTPGSFTGVVNNIVLDDRAASGVGSWTAVKTFYANSISNTVSFYGDGSGADTNSFGTNYMSKGQGTGSEYIQYTPNIVVAGDYDLYQWHPQVLNASASVPHVINYSGGSSTVFANQQTNPGNWSSLGRFYFTSGTSGNVQITDGIPEGGAVAISDALKLVFVTPASVPVTPTALSATAVSATQINLAWTDNATNETAYLVARGTSPGGPYSDVATLPRNSIGYTNAGLATNTAYYYVVRATNFLGSSSNSLQASATTFAPPIITTQPQSTNVNQGATVNFNVIASGTGPLSYQWRLYGTNLPTATSSTYTKANAQTNDAGPYSVVVSNSVGVVTSSNATLAVIVPPSITLQPQNLSVTVGSDATFTITAAGTAPLLYQWRFNGTNLANATTNSYTRNSVQPNHAGNYSVVVSNSADSITSSNALLTVIVPIPLHIDSITILPDGRVALVASGNAAHYGVDGSSNLVDWAELTNFVTSTNTFQYIDAATNLAYRFYRARLIP